MNNILINLMHRSTDV